MARASKTLIISAEQIVDTEAIRAAPDRTIIPYYLVDAVVHAPFGAHPGEMGGLYERDEEEYRAFMKAAATSEGTQEFLQRTIHDLPDHAAYLAQVGSARLESLKVRR
jgi:glutaconate CoA-transferase subunit A